MASRKEVRSALATVMDPEMGISIVDLGLIYDIITEQEKVKVVMTLTSMGCPLFGQIQEDMINALIPLGYALDDIEIDLTFEPPWTEHKMSDQAKIQLGYL